MRFEEKAQHLIHMYEKYNAPRHLIRTNQPIDSYFASSSFLYLEAKSASELLHLLHRDKLNKTWLANIHSRVFLGKVAIDLGRLHSDLSPFNHSSSYVLFIDDSSL